MVIVVVADCYRIDRLQTMVLPERLDCFGRDLSIVPDETVPVVEQNTVRCATEEPDVVIYLV